MSQPTLLGSSGYDVPSEATATSASISVLGERDSGKSTWLAAFLQGLEDQKMAHLRQRRSSQDQRALIKLTDALLDGRFPDRTQLNELLELQLPLQLSGFPFSDQDLDLHLGDYAGEELAVLFKDRTGTWTPRWRQRARAKALVLMLRAPEKGPSPLPYQWDSLSDRQRWQHLLRSRRHLGGRVINGDPAPGGIGVDLDRHAPDPFDDPARQFGEPVPLQPAGPHEASPGDRVLVPRALALIELLQFMRHARGLLPGERPSCGLMRVIVAISAWDTVDMHWREAGPTRWLSQHLPLLEDTLWSSFHEEDLFYCGLSSVGGNLDDPGFRQKYQADPHRGFVEWEGLGGIQTCRDLALPLYFGLQGRRALDLGSPASRPLIASPRPRHPA